MLRWLFRMATSSSARTGTFGVLVCVVVKRNSDVVARTCRLAGRLEHGRCCRSETAPRRARLRKPLACRFLDGLSNEKPKDHFAVIEIMRATGILVGRLLFAALLLAHLQGAGQPSRTSAEDALITVMA